MPGGDATAARAVTASIADARHWALSRLEESQHPFDGIDVPRARSVLLTLESIEPEPWVAAWMSVANDFAQEARRWDPETRAEEAGTAWWQAYQFARIARFPTPTHPVKSVAYDSSREFFAKALSLVARPVQGATVPVDGDSREGRDVVPFFLATPDAQATTRSPVVVVFSGIDTFKEETYVRTAGLRSRGVATLHVDIPGTGESPVHAGVAAERMWTPIFDWIEQSDLDAARVGVLGMSFGGYWATKLAHTHRERLRAAVNWGGGIHRTFQPGWQDRSRIAATFVPDLDAARASIFGLRSLHDYARLLPGLSLLDQGILGEPSSPQLLVGGTDDRQSDPTDIHLALEHGSAKTARLYRGGHVSAPDAPSTIFDWLASQLA
ncbi:alpha/beta hydrolase family protein [Microbacterium sp. RD1]|uniref:alpha/beta hydrolase family protein n=1 Tax=Microbacterium sp. RD1 TaxID=3457313 RepID=UPI003FA5CFA5